jgi:hypothetical protein
MPATNDLVYLSLTGWEQDLVVIGAAEVATDGRGRDQSVGPGFAPSKRWRIEPKTAALES